MWALGKMLSETIITESEERIYKVFYITMILLTIVLAG